jgi:myo-inositol-1(or 4)-monophosphatase
MSLDTFLEGAQTSARRAGEMLKGHLSDAREITYKGSVDLVTNFDKQAQTEIVDYLASRFPRHGFLAEEGLSQDKGSEYRWIIDPLDGTTNFAHGFPVFSVAIALLRAEEILLGVVFDPMRDEMFSAAAGRGAFLNSRPVQVSSTVELDKSLLATGFPYDVRTSSRNNLDHFGDFAIRAQAVRRCGSAAIDLCYVACGRFDGFWELKLAPWDVAAGLLLVREAGGRVTDFRGDPCDIFGDEIVATNSHIHGEMLDVLKL